jgi:hypothetical protein
MSARMVVVTSARIGACRARMASTRPAAATNVTASTSSGAPAETANRAAPSGGPRNWKLISWAACRRPLALARSSGSTRSATNGPEALSKIAPELPSRKVMSARPHSGGAVVRTQTANAATSSPRARSMRHIRVRRSCRSASAPPNRVNSRIGTVPAKVTMLTAAAVGDSAAASSGNTAVRMPSPSSDVYAAATSLRKSVVRACTAPMTGA